MKRQLAIFSAVASIVLATAACGGVSEETASTTPAAPSDAAASAAPSAAAAGPIGPGCADYAKAVPSGAGSVDGMAQDPVATAASNNPLLTTLVSAVSGKLNSKVDLVDTLNGGEFTVFAPVDDAFKKVDAQTLATLKKDSDLLTKVLTYHVVPGQLSPEQVVGMQKTVAGAEVNVTGTPDALMVNGNSVICGGVKTSNATVYLIDDVLTPKS
jgi:uncharacterized surface protein with fasciclin (FAS1) repeats